MIKKSYLVTGVVVLLCLLGLTGCKTDKSVIKGKYMSVHDSSIYYEFSKDGTYITNYYEINDYGKELDDMGITWYDYGTYRIDKNKLILFQGEDESDDTELLGSDFGYIYKNMICSKWEGELPLEKKSEEKYIQFKLSSFLEEIQFKKDGIFELKMMKCTKEICGYSHEHDYEVYKTKTGTYEVDKNKVTCESNDGIVSTFYDTDNGVYCVQYIKE